MNPDSYLKMVNELREGAKRRPQRIEQQQGEPLDFFVMRAFTISIPKLSNDRLRAMIQYIADRGFSELVKRKKR